MATENNNQEQQVGFFWKREITYGQFLGILVTIITSFAISIYHLSIKVTEDRERIVAMEKSVTELTLTMKEMGKENRESNEKVISKLDGFIYKYYESNHNK